MPAEESLVANNPIEVQIIEENNNNVAFN